ncbi:MAG: hypothetical protein DMG24_23455, partial [Acidobacteria bacterium]
MNLRRPNAPPAFQRTGSRRRCLPIYGSGSVPQERDRRSMAQIYVPNFTEEPPMKKTRLKLLHLALWVTMSGLVAVTSARGQFRAGVGGTVTDTSGAVIAGATVTVTNQETGKSQPVTTSDAGFYRVSGLPPGAYTVTVSFTGFKDETVKDIQVHAEEIQGVNVTLQPGTAKETITVSAEAAPQLQTENGNFSANITNRQLQTLPQNG